MPFSENLPVTNKRLKLAHSWHRLERDNQNNTLSGMTSGTSYS